MAADPTMTAATTIAAGGAASAVIAALGVDPAALAWGLGGSLVGVLLVDQVDRWRSILLCILGAPAGALAAELAHHSAGWTGAARWVTAALVAVLFPGLIRALVRTVAGRAPAVVDAGIDRLLSVLKGRS